MKKVFIKLISVILLVCTLTGCSEYKGDIVTITAQQALDKFNNKETFVIYVGQGGCDSCEGYSITLHELTKEYDVIIYYVNLDDKNYVDQKNELIYDYFYRCLWTPTTYMVIEGKTVDLKEKELSYDELEEWLISYGILSKNGN